MHFFIKTLQNCDNQSFQEYFTEKVCFNESLFTYNEKALNHLFEDVLSKRKYFFQKGFWRNKSSQGTIFQEAAPGTLTRYKMEHFSTRLGSLETLASVAKSSIFTYGRGSQTTSGYKSKWRQRSLNYELNPEAAT